MKLTANIMKRFRNISKAAFRFPVPCLFLLTIAVLNAVSIQNKADYEKLVLALATGVFLSAAAQVISERFFIRKLSRLLLSAGSFLLMLAYYYAINPAVSKIGIQEGIRSAAINFALFVFIIWLPSFRRDLDFFDSFMMHFKAFFTSLFFSSVIFAGVSLIILAVDRLLLKLSETTYLHAANIVGVAFAPLLFLSLIPVMAGPDMENVKMKEASRCPSFLKLLISYVLIPLTGVYTAVLYLYIVKTVLTRNWTDRFLAPLSLTYCIAVLILYILSNTLEKQNGSAGRLIGLFRTLIPKLLIPVALFQIISSLVNAADSGIVHSRYYVLLTGVYSLICGIILSARPVKKNGMIAFLAIAFAAISVIPPVDAFTVSRVSQIQILNGTLQKNGMIKNGSILPNSGISLTDKNKIVNSLEYLNLIGELSDASYLPKNFNFTNDDFTKTFGFSSYGTGIPIPFRTVGYSIDSQTAAKAGNYDYLFLPSFYLSDENNSVKLFNFTEKK